MKTPNKENIDTMLSKIKGYVDSKKISPASRTNLGGVYMFEDNDSFQQWNIDPQEVNYTETDGVYEINTLNYTENNGIYVIGDNE